MSASSKASPAVPRRLLAKSFHGPRDAPPDHALLTQHSRDVAQACRSISRVAGPAALRAAGLPEAWLDRFTRALCADGWMQDLGKANEHFQAMVGGQPEITQLLRHEAISGLLVWQYAPLRAWLDELGEDLVLALWGAVGHHRKFDASLAPALGAPATIYAAHEDFKAILEGMAEDLGLGSPPRIERHLVLGRARAGACDLDVSRDLKAMQGDFRDHEDTFAEESARRLLALVKAFGIAADVTASALPRRVATNEPVEIEPFVEEQLSTGLDAEALRRLVHRWAWDRAAPPDAERDETRLPPGFIVRPFQEEVAKSTSRLTLAEAGCGSGKSLAAYLWAEQWCARFHERGERPMRMFFCLPTTGTTTEHFKDYALEAGVGAALAHGRARIDLRTIARTAQQEDATETASRAQDALAAELAKIDALSLWDTPLVVSTADTVLGVMSNALRALCALPAIVQSCIVFDEIHAFDDPLFGHLLIFLKTFPNLPVLLMTASLPEARRRALAEIRPDLVIVPGPAELEALPRYELRRADDEEAAWSAVTAHVKDGGKVLWVRNQVASANETYEQGRRRLPGAAVEVYHSRFRYNDRSRRHRRVVDNFKGGRGGTLLVATQVAEMSLDLSADLLVTDVAPVPSLIQRLGRLNRRADPSRPPDPKPAYVCAPKDGPKPYEADALHAGWAWVDRLRALGRPLSQRDLAAHFAGSATEPGVDLDAAEKDAFFVGVPGHSGVWRTRPGTTRGEGYTASVVLGNDLRAYRNTPGRDVPDRDWLREHEVAIPIRNEMFGWDRVSGVLIAPTDAVLYDYDEKTHEGTGAQWRER
ncbi:CRISPR-associated helicase Cas3' [Polyangium jinanense]|uniref:CRISPR-associated helicase Cas3' n=1 Tax=Polyangium jinanense TaxID=2829994 RepID=UPI0023410460|nr:CRISPR-associated helicase Cas3' [Polyangium jinanense]MDC3952630.1 CRISPR-associated helicase Cas3' [Polyangium jinanense]